MIRRYGITTAGSGTGTAMNKKIMREERETCGVPSGIRLMNLLRERLTEIMDRERANRNSIHLYSRGPYWVRSSVLPISCVSPSRIARSRRCACSPTRSRCDVSVTDRSLRSYALTYMRRRRVDYNY